MARQRKMRRSGLTINLLSGEVTKLRRILSYDNRIMSRVRESYTKGRTLMTFTGEERSKLKSLLSRKHA